MSKISSNRLGDLKAENDFQMLDRAFLETSDYRTILESNDKVVVVGRRGTGKSALSYKLKNDWGKSKNDIVLRLFPHEDQIIGVRALLKKFDNKYDLVRAALKISWECLLYAAALEQALKHYKFQKHSDSDKVKATIKQYYKSDENVGLNLRSMLKFGLGNLDNPEDAIADLASKLGFKFLKNTFKELIEESKFNVYALVDCLDEGYKPDITGVSYISGIIQGTLNFAAVSEEVRPVLFIRDNMFRAVAKNDPDYSRNIEGSALRLHWNENQLLNLAAMRLKIAFSIDQENDIRIWNQLVDSSLNGREGFRHCLRLTLYRPRDLLALLNQGFYNALKDGRQIITVKDIDNTAKEISQTRLDDLRKEYSTIFPSLGDVISIFHGFKASFSTSEVSKKIRNLKNSESLSKESKEDLVFYDSEQEVLKSLYSIGFLGVQDTHSESFSFCHDGRDPDLTISEATTFLVHPCYQVALNLNNEQISDLQATEIHDDYEIEITSFTQEQRNRKIGQLISRFNKIESGQEDANEFEEWCLDSIKTAFAGVLDNIALHPNKDSPQRRDIVATNNSKTGFWKRVLDDYSSRHIIFEVKNYAQLKPDDFRQLASYLVDSYGRIGFFITRSEKREPEKENDLVWIREIYWKQQPNKLIVILSYKHLVAFLEKIRNPQKHDAVEKILIGILDTYHQNYLNEKVKQKKNKKKA